MHRGYVAKVTVVAVLIALGYVGLPAGASHSPKKTAQCTYEVGPTGDFWENTVEDPAGVTADGHVSWGGCGWEFTSTDTGDYPPFSQFFPVSGEYTELKLAIVDDIFATNVGGFACSDVDSDYVCGDGDKGEISTGFCGSSPTFQAVNDADGDGHLDFGGFMGTFTYGALGQAFNCDPTTAPTSTSGGIINPNGGIFMTLSG